MQKVDSVSSPAMSDALQPSQTKTLASYPGYSPGLEGIPAGITQVSFVNPERVSLMYRGYDVRDLSEQASFEEVSYLLLYGKLPNRAELQAFEDQLKAERCLPDEVWACMRQFPRDADLMDALKASVATLSMFENEVKSNKHDANVRKAVRLAAKFPVIIAANYRLSQGQEPIAPDNSLCHSDNFLYMLKGEKPTALASLAFNASLICYADHGFNASTFAGRVTASTMSDLHSATVSAIGALKGPLHGGANEEAMKMLLEIGPSADNAEKWVLRALAEKRLMMGFGHREYKSGDPRAKILKVMARKVCEELGQKHWADTADVVEATVLREKQLEANVDFSTGYLYYVLGLPIPIYTPIFALARVVGWCSHFVEQHDGNKLIRPKAIYEGPDYQPYVALAQR
jgi:2-methylcitrate synthase/citrate synthase II